MPLSLPYGNDDTPKATGDASEPDQLVVGGVGAERRMQRVEDADTVLGEEVDRAQLAFLQVIVRMERVGDAAQLPVHLRLLPQVCSGGALGKTKQLVAH